MALKEVSTRRIMDGYIVTAFKRGDKLVWHKDETFHHMITEAAAKVSSLWADEMAWRKLP